MFQSRRAALRVACVALCLAVLGSPHALEAQALRGTVKDARTGDPVVSALIRLGLTEHYAVSDDEGNFVLEAPGESGVHSLVVTAPGYAKRYEPTDVSGEAPVEVLMAPEPIELEGVEAAVRTFRTKIRVRRNMFAALGANVYALEGALLERSTAQDVWELVARRHGFQFQGFSDYGCPMATIFGRPGFSELFIDDRPVRIGILQEYRPQDFALVEVVEHGRAIRAYTQKYIDWMTENDREAAPFQMISGLCPPAKTPPGTMKRGRPVGNNP